MQAPLVAPKVGLLGKDWGLAWFHLQWVFHTQEALLLVHVMPFHAEKNNKSHVYGKWERERETNAATRA